MPGTLSPLWNDPPADLTLDNREVHVWLANLHLDASHRRQLEQALSPEERSKAARFRFTEGQHRYVAARGFLRMILGRYLGVAPGSIEFEYSDHGKPGLRSGAHAHDLQFNVAHSHHLAVYGLCRGRRTGVDIEKIDAHFSATDIAQKYFASAEMTVLASVPERARTKAFFQCWTCKEAYIKACGAGLSLPLNQFEVGFGPNRPALLHSVDDPRAAERWTLWELPLVESFSGAVAVEGTGLELRCWELKMSCGYRQ